MQARQQALLAQCQALLGVLLGLFLLAHLWQQWPVLEGREAWVDRARHSALPLIGKALLVVVVLGHVVLGFLRLRLSRLAAAAPHGEAPQGAAQQTEAHQTEAQQAGLRWAQVALGVIIVAFVAVHWPMVAWSDGPHATVRDVYAKLWTQLGTPGQLALHTLGIGAVCAHLGLGLGRAAVTLGFAHSKGERTAYTWLAALVAFVVFVLWLQVLASFALGAPLF